MHFPIKGQTLKITSAFSLRDEIHKTYRIHILRSKYTSREYPPYAVCLTNDRPISLATFNILAQVTYLQVRKHASQKGRYGLKPNQINVSGKDNYVITFTRWHVGPLLLKSQHIIVEGNKDLRLGPSLALVN